MHTSLSSRAEALSADVPPELRRWNWAAFFLHVFWGVAHRCYISLLVFVPFVGLVIPFVLGAKGNAWAWQKGRWNSSAQFLAVQRRWVRYALVAYSGVALLCLGLAWSFSQGMQRSEPFQLALAQLERNAEVAQVLGLPLETGWVRGSLELGSSSGTADITFPVTGPRGSGRAYVYAEKHANVWALEQLAVDVDGGGRIALATVNPPNTATSVAAATSATHGRINDFANVLQPEDVAALQAQLEAHQAATGQAFGVTIMPTLAGTSSDTLADRLVKSWSTGRAGSEEGLLILMAIAERTVQIRVAPKLSTAFPEGFVSTVIQQKLEPAFQSRQYGRALATTFDALARQQLQR